MPSVDATGYVNITINGTNYQSLNQLNTTRYAIFNVSGLVAGDYNVTVTYRGDNNYNPSNNYSTFTVSKTNITDIKVSVENVTYGENETVKVTVSDYNVTGSVKIYIYANEGDTTAIDSTTVDLTNGVASWNVSGLAAKENYYVVAVYNGDDNYNATTLDAGKATALFNVTKAQSHVNIRAVDIRVGKDEIVTVYLLNLNASGTIVINIINSTGDIVYTKTEAFTNTSADGITYTFTGLPIGKYNATVNYTGDVNYNDSYDSSEFTVSQIGLSANDTVYKENLTVTVETPDYANGNIQLLSVIITKHSI